MEDLGINVAERVGTKESVGPAKEKKSVLFNAVAVVRAFTDGKMEIIGVHFMNKDKSMVEVQPGETRTVSLNVAVPK
jgi:hypothetical protein